MLPFLARRLGVMLLTMICLTLMVFYLVNLEPNLRKLAISQTEMHATSAELESWLTRNGYRRPFLERYAAWLGVWPKEPTLDPATGEPLARFSWCDESKTRGFSGVIEGNFGCSTSFKVGVVEKLGPALQATALLMFWVMAVMIPIALVIGVLSGMREGSRADRTLSVLSIATTSTPEYVSGVVLSIVFATWLGWLNGSAAAATEGHMSFYNFSLPVATVAISGMGYVARMTRASMIEVMNAQYIRTARLKGLGFGAIVLKHALRNALIAPFTVIMLLFPWLLTGVVIVEVMFRYQGFGQALVDAGGNNDIDLLLACSIVSVVLVLMTQLVSDVGYAWLNPRIRVH
ncbi:MAG: ABC transporter permease [Hyphomicrobiales bacterium]|nr:ABC transporter permease [Hyphomicrobiales bacterium]